MSIDIYANRIPGELIYGFMRNEYFGLPSMAVLRPKRPIHHVLESG